MQGVEQVPRTRAELNALYTMRGELEEQIKNNKANLVLSDKNLVEITEIVEKLRKNITE